MPHRAPWPVVYDGDTSRPIPESWLEHGEDRGEPRLQNGADGAVVERPGVKGQTSIDRWFHYSDESPLGE